MKILNTLGKVIYENKNIDNMKELVEEAVKKGINLECANLESANLESAYLKGTKLRGANLGNANHFV